MAIPSPASAVAAFASFVRDRLADVGGSLGPLFAHSGDGPRAAAAADTAAGARQLALVIIGAAAPFAPTSHARARLLRQAHASGLLSDREVEQVRLSERLALPAAGTSGAQPGAVDGASVHALGASG